MPEKQKGILNTVKNLYASADLYASGIALTVNKEGRAKSIIGTSVTLLVLFATFWMSSSTISNVVNVTSPRLTYDSAQGTENITGLDFSNFFLSYSFFTPQGTDKKFGNDTNDYEIAEVDNS